LWSAELLARVIELGTPQNYESLWWQEHGHGLMAISANLCTGTSSGVLKSTDDGGNWSPLNIGLTNLWVGALFIDPITPFTLYAGTEGVGGFDMHQLLYQAYLQLIGRAQ
jgi:hypothetical protein